MSKNLLEQSFELGVEPTEITRKLTLGGTTKAYQVYRIPLELLYFNDQNDRIATWLSKYKEEHPDTQLDHDASDYNDIIQQFITQSNPDALKKTQENIKLFEQREPGVVLSDGRIIDGNRRYTCLRNLSKTMSKFGYFEAVILPNSLESNAKQIKMLELSIQHGEESKVDYDPIDRLVGIYNDVVDSQLLTEQEYAESTNASLSEVRQQIEIAKLLSEYLDFIGAPKQYYIAREMQLNGPLVELYGILRKIKDDDTKERMKNSAFTNFLMAPSTDMTRFIRRVKTIAPTQHLTGFLDEQDEIAEKTLDAIPAGTKVTIPFINENLRTREDIKDELTHSLEKAYNRVTNEKTRNRPEELVDRAIAALSEVNIDIVKKLTEQQKESLCGKIKELRDAVDTLSEEVSNV